VENNSNKKYVELPVCGLDKWACNCCRKRETGRLVTFDELVSNERGHEVYRRNVYLQFLLVALNRL
jgi:hypothetical protein